METLLNVENVAELLKVSPRQVYRMADEGRMPKPFKMGHNTRWHQAEVDAWIEAGCPPVISKK